MSQYPSPYYPPNVQPPYLPYAGSADLLAPAKRASLLMIALGLLLVLLGGCFIGLAPMITKYPSQQTKPMLDQIQNAYHTSPEVVFRSVGAFVLLPGIPLLLLSFFVRKGGRAATRISLVAVGLILAFLVLQLSLAVLHPIDANTSAGICMESLIIGAFGLLFYWLLQAARSSPSVTQAQQQYMAQYWQYQQNMQAYQGYGYAAPPQEGQVYQPQPNPPALPPPDQTTPPPPSGG